MGSESGGGGSGGYDAAPMQYASQQKRRKKEEQTLQSFRGGDDPYVRSSGGNIVRSSTGSAVTTKAGRQMVDEYKSTEVDEMLGSQKSTVAQLQLEKRLTDTPFIGTVGIMAKKNLERQLANLKAGGSPQFRRTATGRYVAVGVNRPGQAEDSSPNIANDPSYSIGGDDRGGVARRAVAAQDSTAVQPTSAAQRALFQGLRQGAEKGAKRRQFVTRSDAFRV